MINGTIHNNLSRNLFFFAWRRNLLRSVDAVVIVEGIVKLSSAMITDGLRKSCHENKKKVKRLKQKKPSKTSCTVDGLKKLGINLVNYVKNIRISSSSFQWQQWHIIPR